MRRRLIVQWSDLFVPVVIGLMLAGCGTESAAPTRTASPQHAALANGASETAASEAKAANPTQPVSATAAVDPSTAPSSLIVETTALTDNAQSSNAPKSDAAAEPSPNSKKAPAAKTWQDADLMADIDDAMQLLKAREYRTFLEHYASVEDLRLMRQGRLPQRPEFATRLLAALQIVRAAKPEYDRSGAVATFQFDPSALGGLPMALPASLEENDKPAQKLPGFGDNLKTALAAAAKTLESGDVVAYVTNMFPPAIVARWQRDDCMDAVVMHLKANAGLVQSTLADLQRLQKLEPEIDAGKALAKFTLDRPEGPPCTIKLQLVDGHWRLFDDGTRVREELLRHAKLEPAGTTHTLRFERIGKHWRLLDTLP